MRRHFLLLLAVAISCFTNATADTMTISFSVDPASPAIDGNITPDDVLKPGPTVHTQGRNLGLQDNFLSGFFDNLADFSFGKDPIRNPLYFSVDRVAVGLPGTAVFERAAPGVETAAGDVFVTLPPAGSNALAIAGVSLGLSPGFFGDDLDGLTLGSAPTPNIYFAIDRLSASNDFGAGTLASDLLVSAGIGRYAVYATNEMMHLDPRDAIDGLVLLDRNLDQSADARIDQALFSLDPFSPDTFTFTGLPYVPCVLGHMSPADVCFTDFSGAPPSLWASAGDIGLQPGDNVDALATVPEPGSLVLLGTCCGLMLLFAWRARIRSRVGQRRVAGLAWLVLAGGGLAKDAGAQVFAGKSPPIADSLATLSVDLKQRKFQWSSSDSVLGEVNTGGFASASIWNYFPGAPARLVFTGAAGAATYYGDVLFDPYNRAVVDVIKGAGRVRYLLNIPTCACTTCSATFVSALANDPTATFLNDSNAVVPDTDALKVSNFLTTAGLPTVAATAFGTSSDDRDNFRFEIDDPGVAAASVKVIASVVDPDLVGPPAPLIYTLGNKLGTKFRGPYLRLVSDAVDDAASGNGAAADPDMQTILVRPGFNLLLQYLRAPAAAVCATRPVCRPSNEDGDKAIRRVNLDIRIAFIDANGNGIRDAGEEVIAPAAVQAEIDEANRRWAQDCIRYSLAVAGFTFFRLPAGAVDGAGRFRNQDPNNPLALGPGGLAVVGASAPAGGQTVTVYFVPTFNIAANAEAFPPVRMKIGTDVENAAGRVPGAAVAQANSNTIFIGTIAADGTTLGHELGHILVNTNDSAQPATILFPAGIPQAAKSVNAAWRLSRGTGVHNDPANNAHTHFTGFDAASGMPTSIAIPAADFDVPGFARVTRAAAGVTQIGNTLLQQ